jgi:hypothetical protein
LTTARSTGKSPQLDSLKHVAEHRPTLKAGPPFAPGRERSDARAVWTLLCTYPNDIGFIILLLLSHCFDQSVDG